MSLKSTIHIISRFKLLIKLLNRQTKAHQEIHFLPEPTALMGRFQLPPRGSHWLGSACSGLSASAPRTLLRNSGRLPGPTGAGPGLDHENLLRSPACVPEATRWKSVAGATSQHGVVSVTASSPGSRVN